MKRRLLIPALVLVLVVSSLTLVWTAPVAASSEYPTGPYWYAEFFNARWPTARPVLTRYDSDIYFDWGTGSPDVVVNADNFSARWTRTVDLAGGVYKFWVIHDDGVLLWIDDQLIINQWYDQPADLEYTDGLILPNVHYEEVSLSAGPHRIKLEYYEHGKNAVIKMGWTLVEVAPFGFVPEPAGTLQTDKIHLVRPGEWLYKIARQYGVSVRAIIEANALTSLRLVPGQELIIPNGASSQSAGGPSPSSAGCSTTYVVRPGENLFRIALRFNTSIHAMATQNGISAPYTVRSGQSLCVP